LLKINANKILVYSSTLWFRPGGFHPLSCMHLCKWKVVTDWVGLLDLGRLISYSCSIDPAPRSAQLQHLSPWEKCTIRLPFRGLSIKTEIANQERKTKQDRTICKKSQNFKLDERSSSSSEHILRDGAGWPVLWAYWWDNCCWAPPNAYEWCLYIIRSQQPTWWAMQVHRWQVSLPKESSLLWSCAWCQNWRYSIYFKADIFVCNLLLLGKNQRVP